MKERPILFSAPMVRAILDGRKTQTRRAVKTPRCVPYDALGIFGEAMRGDPKATAHVRREYGNVYVKTGGGEFVPGLLCPYGVIGDQLWVRETFYVDTPDDDEDRLKNTYYRADGECCYQIPECQCADVGGTKWRPSIHMPRWASRITLEVTDVRVQRLQDIDAGDAQAEGARRFDDIPSSHPYPNSAPRWSCVDPPSTEHCLGSARMAFASAWIEINGPDAWAANPWVWAITFKRVKP